MHESEKPTLIEAIERLYLTFSEYSSWSQLPGCPCCVTEHDVQRLMAKPLRQLTHSDLEKFGSLNQSLWGNRDDYRHFLPRLFELCTLRVSEEDARWWEFEQTIRGLNVGNWRQRPSNEQRSIEDFLKAWWQVIVAGGSEFPFGVISAADIFESLVDVLDDIGFLLADEARNTNSFSFELFPHVWHSLTNNITARPRQRREITEWAVAPETIEWLEYGLRTFSNMDWAQSYADTVLEVRAYVGEQSPIGLANDDKQTPR